MKFLLGVVTTLVFSIATNVVWGLTENPGKVHKIAWTVKSELLEGGYLYNPLTGRCSNAVRPKGYSGEGRTNAEYFGCDSFQKMINLE